MTFDEQYCEGGIEVIGQPDKVALFYNSVFDDSLPLKDKNKIAFLTFQQLMSENDRQTIIEILTDNALLDLHPSIILAALMTVDQADGIDDARRKAKTILNIQKAKY